MLKNNNNNVDLKSQIISAVVVKIEGRSKSMINFILRDDFTSARTCVCV